jgi:pimeloyl-ACP methyl ester carboxylesterase
MAHVRNRGKSETPETGPLGRWYDVRGKRLLLHRSGIGSPSVVFLSGAGTVGLDYLNVQQLAAQLTTSVFYDRAGTGWSDRVKLPRSSAQVTDELRDLLRTAGVPAPYLLAGHSLGGLYARHYAQRFPDEVAGLLLLDPAHEDYDAYMPQRLNEMRQAPVAKQLNRLVSLAIAGAVRSAVGRGLLSRLPTVRRYRELYRRLFAQEMADWPREIREVLVERHASLEWLSAGLQEAQNVDQLYDEVRRAAPIPDIPLIVLCSMGVDDFRRAVSVGESESQLSEELEGKRRLYATLAASVTRGENRLVDAGHLTIHLRHPDAVRQAIKDLLGR